MNHFLINDIASIARLTDETFKPSEEHLSFDLNTLSNSQSYLTFELGLFGSKKGTTNDRSALPLGFLLKLT